MEFLSSYRTLLEKLGCAVVEYNVKKDLLIANRLFVEKYSREAEDGQPLTLTKLQQIHPEFNFRELEEAIQLIQKTKQPHVFETAIAIKKDKVYWIEITLIPHTDVKGNMTDILVAVIDTTKAHEVSDREEMISNTPNGIHRCYLSNPIHMEFASTGMCQMVGYTSEEMDAIIGPERKLSRLVHPEDLEKFRKFVQEAAGKEGRYTCEYRMQKKDGTYITVLDVMEVKRASSGIMYGYSSVTDITDFQRAEEVVNAVSNIRNKHRQEVEKLEEQLKNAQLKNSMSQMQPHFLYNALASIREVVLEDPQYASDLIYDFSTHLRACIRAMSSHDLVPFSQELDNINAYVNIEKMRFGDKLHTQFDIKDRSFPIVPLSIQPLVENAIRHGIYERGSKGGTVTVCTELTERHHVIRVSDDGVGFDYQEVMRRIKDENKDSTGLSNVIFRLKNILKAEINIDSTPGIGTVITVFIPREQEEKSENDIGG